MFSGNTSEFLSRFNPFLFSYLPNWISAINVLGVSPPPFVHILWSLGVEEQLYVLFPFTAGIILVSKRPKIIIIGIIAFSMLSRLVYIILLPQGEGSWMYYSTFSYLDVYLIAGLFGALHARGDLAMFRGLIGNSYVFVAAIVLLIYFMHVFAANISAPAPYSLISLISYPILSALTSFCVLSLLHTKGCLLGSLLSILPVRAYGVLSYSIYVWHMTVLYFIHEYVGESGPVSGTSDVKTTVWIVLYFLFFFSLTLAVACASYGLIERPFLRIKERYSVSGTGAFFSWQKYFVVSFSVSVFLFLALKAI